MLKDLKFVDAKLETSFELQTRAKFAGVHRVPATLCIAQRRLTVRPRWNRFPLGPTELVHTVEFVEIYVPKRQFFWTVPQLLLEDGESFSLVQIAFRQLPIVQSALEASGFQVTNVRTSAVAMINAILLERRLLALGRVSGDSESRGKFG